MGSAFFPSATLTHSVPQTVEMEGEQQDEEGPQPGTVSNTTAILRHQAAVAASAQAAAAAHQAAHALAAHQAVAAAHQAAHTAAVQAAAQAQPVHAEGGGGGRRPQPSRINRPRPLGTGSRWKRSTLR